MFDKYIKYIKFSKRNRTYKGSASIFPELSARNLQYRKFDMNE